METVIKKMAHGKNHKQQDLDIQQWKKDEANAQAELEARLKTQEYKEMLKRLK